MDAFARTELLLGADALRRLASSRVAVFGLGGVGGYAVEALARGGIGALELIDHDTVSVTNLNRQLYATLDTVGCLKTEVAAKRIASVNPNAEVVTHSLFYLPENADRFDLSRYDYIIDAIDTVSAKIELAVRAAALGVPLISCMGTGNKLDPSALEVADLSETSVCPLARVMRRELKARGITRLKVVYSKEPPIRLPNGERTPGSVSFVPPVAGFLLAGEVIKSLGGIV